MRIKRSGTRLFLLAFCVAACASACSSSDDNDDTAAGGGGTGGEDSTTTCASVSIVELYPEATVTGECVSEAGRMIADSVMDLADVTIDNVGESMTPCVEVQCDDDYAYIISNNLPHYDFVQTTPNALVEAAGVFRIPLVPKVVAGTDAAVVEEMTGCEAAYDAYVAGAAPDEEPGNFCADDETGYLTETLSSGVETYAQLPCLSQFGVLINGVSANGPNEAGNGSFGDPVLEGPFDATSGAAAALDYCGGHTGRSMHYHGIYDACFETDEDNAPAFSYADAALNWTQLGLITDACTEESGIVGWSVDGYPIKGPCACVARDSDGVCTSVKRARSAWHYAGISSHVAVPDASLAVEGVECSSDDDCCTDDNCDFACNYVLAAGAQAGNEVARVCTLVKYAWCTRVFADQTETDVSAEDFVYLDRCNGRDGVDGYAYYATGTFPYLQGCFHGEPVEQAMADVGGGPPGGGMPGM